MSQAKMNSSTIIGAAVVLIIIIGVVYLLTGSGSRPTSTTSYTTTASGSLTITTVTSLTTTIVANQSTATGPNLASCNGYNYSTTVPNQNSVGSCNWRGGLMNVTIIGGIFTRPTISLIQQNVTSSPFNATFAGSSCTTRSNVTYVQPGNYKVILYTGATVSGSTCGSATARLSH